MPHVATLSSLALLSAVGALAGAQLGRSAVSMINPVFFSALPETHFYADDVPTPYHLGQPDLVRPDEYWGNTFNVGGRPHCLDCPGNFVEPLYAAADPAPRAPRADKVDPAQDRAEPEAASTLDRYMSFPVTEEEARVSALPPESLAERSASAGPVGM